MIERLDGFTADGFGNAVEGEPQPGDVIRVEGRIEYRFTEPPIPVELPAPTTLDQAKQDALAALIALQQALSALG